jgi:hypothetical protein
MPHGARPRRAAATAGIVLTLVSSVVPWTERLRAQTVVPVDQVTALKARYPFVRFSLLSSFDVPDVRLGALKPSPHETRSPSKTLAIPREVARLDGQAVSIRGYMLPLAMDGDRVTDFLLTDSMDSCHFGTVGAINQWVLVTMVEGRAVPFPKAVPITTFGRLSVGLETRDGLLTSIYRLSGDMIAIH